MEGCIHLLYLLPLFISLVYSQQCSSETSSVCPELSSISRAHLSLNAVLQEQKSTLRVLDILIAGNSTGSNSDVTVLSSLMDIGVIPALGYVTRKDPAMYIQWMQIYKAIDNPLVFFTDRLSVAREMIKIRQQRPTVAVVIEKNSSWAFGFLSPRYAKIFEDENYPKHYPNTMYAEYATVNHLKVELMQIVTSWNYFHTPAAAWLDVGAYRNAVNNKDFRPFRISNLAGYDPTKVTLNAIREAKTWERNHRFIMKHSPSIYAGGFWIGHIDPLKVFTSEYRKHVEILLDEGLANCDEQVLASMFVEGTQFNPLSEIQPFRAKNYPGCDGWLCLAHQTRESGLL